LSKRWLEGELLLLNNKNSKVGRPKEAGSAENISKFLGEKNWSKRTVDQVLLVKNRLEKNITITVLNTVMVKRPQGGGSQPSGVSAEDISKFLGVKNM
jgi:hypothetical protein